MPSESERTVRSLFRLAVTSVVSIVLTAAASSDVSVQRPDPDLTANLREWVRLGEKLFEDRRLSADGQVSCASCHQRAKAFTDGLRVARGLNGNPGTRNTPTLLGIASAPFLNWDGRRTTLEDQVGEPLLHPLEHGLVDDDDLVSRLVAAGDYASSFERLSGNASMNMPNVKKALAAYVRSLETGTSQFDRFFVQGVKGALSSVQQQGLVLFTGSAGCSACHKIGSDARFTDDEFHSLGVGMERGQRSLASVAKRTFELDERTRFRAILEDAEIASLGRFVITRRARDIGKFRTPSLRNVAMTAPYMHDGSLSTLEEALERELYYRGLASSEPVVLTLEERRAIIAFLATLTDAEYLTPQPALGRQSGRSIPQVPPPEARD